MLTLETIRADLKEIRYYYMRESQFNTAFEQVASNAILEKVQRYSEAVKSAPIKLYDLYINLYTKNYTQEAFAIELSYSPQHVQVMHKKLLLFLREELR